MPALSVTILPFSYVNVRKNEYKETKMSALSLCLFNYPFYVNG
ncbi:hypothetical protein B4073_4057 [Bacillus subtilis]|uniref:Uncharacterized protein n=1 Tax=Bacillus subtilis subsp. subtilis TaxID=135461 RepID=A0ABD3ZUX7_BACIU|nr:hypothetical protein B4067_4433 [Bacillus subtilis subsp. subtilis]KIN29357.1 hypothetical protein B4069_4128 [Bacillus subtilis]KIN30146.1 hypothetical protein B4068_3978 [Bacillus subtilis]KIN34373.1 hypothetical protein B4070_4048 [Bacillus subtilis]KIN41393.1 hypothetical protein B4072_4070 [Bacillus subtilis]